MNKHEPSDTYLMLHDIPELWLQHRRKIRWCKKRSQHSVAQQEGFTLCPTVDDSSDLHYYLPCSVRLGQIEWTAANLLTCTFSNFVLFWMKIRFLIFTNQSIYFAWIEYFKLDFNFYSRKLFHFSCYSLLRSFHSNSYLDATLSRNCVITYR